MMRLSRVRAALYPTGKPTARSQRCKCCPRATCAWLQGVGELPRISPGDVVYGVLPLTHVFGPVLVMTANHPVPVPIIRLEGAFFGRKTLSSPDHGGEFLSALPQMHALVEHIAKEQGLTQLNFAKRALCVVGGRRPL